MKNYSETIEIINEAINKTGWDKEVFIVSSNAPEGERNSPENILFVCISSMLSNTRNELDELQEYLENKGLDVLVGELDIADNPEKGETEIWDLDKGELGIWIKR